MLQELLGIIVLVTVVIKRSILLYDTGDSGLGVVFDIGFAAHLMTFFVL